MHSLAILVLSYVLTCSHVGSELPAARGSLSLGGRTVRIELWAGTSETRVLLGKAEDVTGVPTPELVVPSACRLEGLRSRVETSGELSLRHAPFLVVRGDQYASSGTDLPLMVGYSRHDSGGRTYSLKYTTVFSDEDSLTTAAELDAQMARYGRRTDIEWTYEVELEKKTDRVLARRYHSDLFGGVGHATSTFNGEFVPGTENPVLYVIARHNVFRDRPNAREQREKVGYHLVPSREIPSPQARESLMWRSPWSFYVSDLESAREGKLSRWFTDYLFVRLRGSLSRGSFRGVIRFDSGETVKSGDGAGNVDRLGEDLWQRESYTAIPVGSLRGTGRLYLEQSSAAAPDLHLEAIGFHRIVSDDSGYRIEDLDERFRCRLDGMRTECRF